MIIDHFGLAVGNYEQSRAFYTEALAPLGIEPILEIDGWVGFGRFGKPEFWFGEQADRQLPMHFAFTAESRAAVDAFHRAALAAGGTDNGAPGLRENYHPHYYGAFVVDPDGHNIEAVCHAPDG